MIFLYVPCKNIDEAKKIGKVLIEKRMAGRVDIIPTQSVFRGARGIEETEGVAMFVKTIDKKIQEVEDIVREYHSNRIPCIATFMLYRMNREFKEWLITSTA